MPSYLDWNERLLCHVLGTASGRGPVIRIPATPEELCFALGRSFDEVASLRKEEVDAVVDDFVSAVRTELGSTGLLTYCLLYRTKNTDWFSPAGNDVPYFFAVLWLTCLIAYGYPTTVEGDFHARLRSVVGRSASLTPSAAGGLDDVWEDLARWVQEAAGFRELRLPPRCDRRTNIGRSHYLAFPHRFDRERLSKVLRDAGLLGEEPPVRRALELLRREASNFSREFQADLEALFEDFLAQHRDPRESPFWSAVRLEAKYPSTGQPAQIRSAGAAELRAEWDDDGLLSPFLVFDPKKWCPPDKWETAEFDDDVSDVTMRRVVLEPSQLADALANPKEALRGHDLVCVSLGVVPLLDVTSDRYRVAEPTEVTDTDSALVRDDLAEDIVGEFGGISEPAGLRGWSLITGVKLRQREKLGGRLERLTFLMTTSEAPRPSLIGGIRVGRSFLRVAGHADYLPSVRARGASAVAVHRDGDFRTACIPDPHEPDLWQLPSEVLSSRGRVFEVVATFESEVLEYTYEQASACRLVVEDHVLTTAFKGVPSGDFQRETCERCLVALRGPAPSVPLDGLSSSPQAVLDVLPLDPTVRWLGPGYGEMSLEPGPRFPWLVVGGKKRPDLLLLDVPSVSEAPQPAPTRSSNDGDRRIWRSALSKAKRTAWRKDGDYVPLEDWSHDAKDLLAAYRANRNQGEAVIPPTALESRGHSEEWGVDPRPETARLRDVLAGLFASRSGIPLREVHFHIGKFCGLPTAHTLRQQIVRSLAEAGAVDVLRRADGRQRIVTGRRPRVVVVKKGPAWIGTVLGLLPSTVLADLHNNRERLGIRPASALRGPSGFESPGLRMVADELIQFEELARRTGLEPCQFVIWNDPQQLPEHFRIRGETRAGAVPSMYGADASWCWRARTFKRQPDEPGRVSVERRRDAQRVPIYVVVECGESVGWSYSRTWALIAAYERLGEGFLVEDERGVLLSTGESPVHLPLPLGRLCAVLGLGLPGPRIADGSVLDGYYYPLGPQLRRLLVPHLPAVWMSSRE